MQKSAIATAATGLLAAGLLFAPAGSAAPNTPAPFEPAPISWGPCEDESLQKAGAECGMLEVPLDYANPGGEKISLAVSQVKHTVPEEQYQGAMLLNPGGPGGSGLYLATLGSSVPGNAGAAYDWVGFDPRGVGSSKPALSCDPNYFGHDRPDYLPTTPEKEQEWLTRASGYAESCDKTGGALLDHMKTTDSVEDMESIRKALGQEKLNYYGFSYGTYLGQVYGTLHPERLRRVVMDGVVNVEDVWYDANLNQDVAFDRNIKIFFDWVARYDSVYHLGTTGAQVERLFYEQRAKLDAQPAGGEIGSSEWTDLFLSAGYGQTGWDKRAKAFAGWVHRGEWQPLVDIYDASNTPGDDNGFAAYNAVQCSDVQWPQQWGRWRADNWVTHAKAPFETWANAWYNASCLNWPAKAGEPVNVDGGNVEGALLISEELDAATPFPGALEARKRFPHASLISLPGGTTHSGSLSGNACVDDRIADYLTTGELPARKPGEGSDVTCEPLPQPTPEGAATIGPERPEQPKVLRDALRHWR
ncbi:alpha/beta hydrolase [Saccharopolyspora gloriosae]|uniref:alpha/beta hydrolase n=1 Tax=Saccharopolyspora gloriosae TaxID=455344 RepID=UPI001FB7DF99|nr:alpha/beta hydrolase [Saccharopolyspora gloriosae]